MKKIVDIKLTGIAGSGKTTIAEAIIPVIESLGSKCFWMGSNSQEEREHLINKSDTDFIVFISDE